MTRETMEDYEVDGAKWIDVSRIGSRFEEQVDISRINGSARHRKRVMGTEPHELWQKGPAPT